MKHPRVSALLLFPLYLGAQDLDEDLLAAARKGDVAQMKTLLDKGAAVNAKTHYGQTPLFFACDRGHVEVVKLLLAKGADVNAKDNFYGATALSWAANKGHTEIVRLLIDKAEGGAAQILSFGVQRGNAALVKLALEKGVAKDALSTALVTAERTKKPEIAELLKQAGAQPPPIVQLDPETLASYAGRYRGGRSGNEFDFVFSIKDGKLVGEVVGQPTITYAPADKTHFDSVEFPGVNVEFNLEGGKVIGMTVRQGGATLPFKRVEQK